MRTGITLAVLLFVTSLAQAHSYRIGDLEIIHPTIMVPLPSSDSTCAHMTIINHGAETDYFLEAYIGIARNTKLLHVASHDSDISSPSAVAIAPGGRLELQRHEWCLFLSNISKSLEADMGEYPARLTFRNAGAIEVELTVDAPHQ